MHFLFGAGGTGGHLYPAIAVAESLRKINKDFKITFTGRTDKIEGKKVAEFGFDFLPIDVKPLSLRQGFSSIINLLKFIKSRNELVKFIKKNKIDAVIVCGAYISIAPGFAAASTKTPLFLMESNVNPGKAISLLTARSKTVFTSFEDSREYFPEKFKHKITFTGNPIRNSFENLLPQSEAKKKLGFDTEKPLLLIFGGSLGAESINKFVANNYENILEKGINIAWQTGLNNKTPQNLSKGIKAYSFIDDMATFYSAADLIICRSGASTVSELALCKKPAILIPYPSASNNEQLRNAEVLSKNNAAIYELDKNIHSNLLTIVLNTIFDSKKLLNMSIQIEKFAKPNAANDIANIILDNIE